ncbi:MAG: 23S rRNA (pseudouridine(1915)-N(3))-methyltransferase RlmH [Congregibacter sp.]
MRVTVHSVAGKMPRWVDAGIEDYARRLPREIKLGWRDVPLAARRGNADGNKLCEREGAALLKGLRGDDHCVALDVAGKGWAAEDLAEQMQDWMMQGRAVSFLIGGPDGLSSACLAAANQRWSLGPMVLPHPLVRIVLVEQLYRAWTITIGHPYHRA